MADSHEKAMDVARRIHALAGGPEVTRKAVARELARLDPTDAAERIQCLLLLAREGWEPAGCVLGALVAALDQEASSIPHAGALRRLARLQELPQTEALFATGSPQREYDPGAASKADAKLFSLPLGALKTRARLTRDPDELAQLAVASEPSVIRNVLLNPRLTEELVVRIAARRPARPEPLVEIWRSSRWSVRPAVRRALARNPYLPPEVGAKVVALLGTTDLLQLAEDSCVHPTLREQARVLLAASPHRPVPPRPAASS